jgi:predicted glycogen debranching enzyme
MTVLGEAVAAPPTILERPLVRWGRAICGDLDAGLGREWLVTNGLGGYASGTLAGPNTRRYHGLLVAALTPPVERTVLVGGLVEWATIGGRRYPLSAHEYAGGTVDPQGYRHLESFALEGTLPVWTYNLGGALLERRVFMAYGANTSYVRYRLLRATAPLSLEITPLVTYHDFHALSRGQGWRPGLETQPQGTRVRAFEGAHPYWLLAEGGDFAPGGDWYWNFYHREEAARGLDAHGDLYAAGVFRARLAPGEAWTLVLSAEERPDLDGERALAEEQDRQRALLRRAESERSHPAVQQLVLAADQFLVRRGEGTTVIAGYHWFNDWGRDTMIALPGLSLATGRPEDAASILHGFAPYIVDGLLPNNFPDHGGVVPGYNTVDATLWYAQAIRAYEQATGDSGLVDALLPALREIADKHIAGTRFNIHLDPNDGLLYAGEPGVQLTWMDAKVGDLVVTPRVGKPVEINALWYNLLRALVGWLRARGQHAEAERYAALAERCRDSFRSRFVHPQQGFLADVVDGPQGDDWTVRPNQIFAVSLPEPLLEGDAAKAVVDAVAAALLTSYGLRSLSPEHPAYRGDYGGDPYCRDTGYHQGPVWTWLMGAFVEAHLRVCGDRQAALSLLHPFEDHLRDACLGSISEILEGDEPHTPRGCVAQAWGVAEILRVWKALEVRSR